jgi:hypothetical protein
VGRVRMALAARGYARTTASGGARTEETRPGRARLTDGRGSKAAGKESSMVADFVCTRLQAVSVQTRARRDKEGE